MRPCRRFARSNILKVSYEAFFESVLRICRVRSGCVGILLSLAYSSVFTEDTLKS